jgi:hypothetical protein
LESDLSEICHNELLRHADHSRYVAHREITAATGDGHVLGAKRDANSMLGVIWAMHGAVKPKRALIVVNVVILILTETAARRGKYGCCIYLRRIYWLICVLFVFHAFQLIDRV